MIRSVFICAIREIRGENFFPALPWVAGEARAGYFGSHDVLGTY